MMLKNNHYSGQLDLLFKKGKRKFVFQNDTL